MDDGAVVLMLIVGGALVVGILLLMLAIAVFVPAVAVALNLLRWAAEHGFVGVALYVIVWVVATPLMIVICVGGGIIWLWSERAQENADALPARRMLTAEEYDRLYHEPLSPYEREQAEGERHEIRRRLV